MGHDRLLSTISWRGLPIRRAFVNLTNNASQLVRRNRPRVTAARSIDACCRINPRCSRNSCLEIILELQRIAAAREANPVSSDTIATTSPIGGYPEREVVRNRWHESRASMLCSEHRSFARPAGSFASGTVDSVTCASAQRPSRGRWDGAANLRGPPVHGDAPSIWPTIVRCRSAAAVASHAGATSAAGRSPDRLTFQASA